LSTLAAMCCLRAQIYEVGKSSHKGHTTFGVVSLPASLPTFQPIHCAMHRTTPYHTTQSQDNRARAVAWCKNALRLDVYCVEALDFLVERKLLRYDRHAHTSHESM
jgi:hypothetical protein